MRWRKRAGRTRNIQVPVFGEVNVGKTWFLYASLNSLLRSAEQAGIPVSLLDQSSLEYAGTGVDLIQFGRDVTKGFF